MSYHTAAHTAHTDTILGTVDGHTYALRIFESEGIRPQIVVHTESGDIGFRIGETTDYHGERVGLEAVCDGFTTHRYTHTFYTNVMRTATDWMFGYLRREDAAWGKREATSAARSTIREVVSDLAGTIMLNPLLIGELEAATRKHNHRAALRELEARKRELEEELAHVNARLAALAK